MNISTYFLGKGDTAPAPEWITRAGWLLTASFLLLMPFRHWFELPMLLMALLGLWLLWSRPLDVIAMPAFKPLMILALCFWLPMLASLPDAINLSRAAGTASTFVRFPLAAIFVLFALRAEESRRRLIMLLGIFLSVSVACVCLQGMYGHINSGVDTVIGLFAGQRGVVFVHAVLAPLYFLWIRRAAQHSRWVWLLLPIYFLAILLSGRRAAWIMLGVSMFFLAIQLVWVERLRWVWKKNLGVIILTLLAPLIAWQQPEFRARLDVTAGLASGDYAKANMATSLRLPIWKVAINVAEDHWLNGIGPRGFRYIYPQYGEKDDPFLALNPDAGPTHPHQLMLEIAAETGVIGIVGYLAALVYWLRLLVVAVQAKRLVAIPLMLGVLLAILPFNAHMAFYASFWSCVTWWLIMMSLALWQTDAQERT